MAMSGTATGVNEMAKQWATNAAGARVEAYRHGAHVSSWTTASGEELLYLSKLAVYKEGKAIRGGIPVCLPQFAKLGPLQQQHGFARNVPWVAMDAPPGHIAMSLSVSPDLAAQYGVQGSFDAVMTVHVNEAGSLLQSLQVVNTSEGELPFTCALHTYFSASDIQQIKIEGLTGCTYKDSVDGGAVKTEDEPAVTFSNEVDRIYAAVPGPVKLVDSGKRQCVEVAMSGFSDVVIWNPWADKSKAMADFGDEDYRVMVCIEAAVASSGPIKLQPNETWVGQQTCTLLQL